MAEKRRFRLDDVTVTANVEELSENERVERLSRNSLLTEAEAEGVVSPEEEEINPVVSEPKDGPKEGK